MGNVSKSPTSTHGVRRAVAAAAEGADARYRLAGGLRHQLNKVFPRHWSFLLGEVALYSFIVLILTGVYLTLFFDPSMEEVVYQGPMENLQGLPMSRAFESTLEISFEVRGGLLIRQMHHWAALVFVAAMVLHMMRVFFTGAFRRPREATWVLGALLLIIGVFEGFFGYSLPDDLLSGTGVRATISGIILSVPIAGTWLHWALFGGEFPGTEIIPRLYALHVLILPAIMVLLLVIHFGLVWYQKHTQFPGVRRSERNVVGVRIAPAFAVKAASFFTVVTGVIALLAGMFQINAVWNLGPYNPAMVSAGTQPDWYLAWADGLLRLWPAWGVYLGDYSVPPVFFAGIMGMTILFALLLVYPFLERKLSGDTAHHNLLQRPRDAPVRTGIGVMALTFMAILEVSGYNDIVALTFDISLNAMTWIGRIALLVAPPLAYAVTYRICLGLQRSDREVLEHGIETGIITRRPDGGFIEIHQPLSGDNGHPVPLVYQGAPVPKKVNRLGAAGKPVAGSLLRPDASRETDEVG